VAAVVQEPVGPRRDVRIQLRLCGHGDALRELDLGDRAAGERVVTGHDDEVLEPGDRDAVLVIVPAHAVDLVDVAGLGVERDDEPGLLGAG
jgi:hypothetical protein